MAFSAGLKSRQSAAAHWTPFNLALKASDPITLPFTPDLIQTAITSLSRQLHHLGEKSGGLSFNRLRGILAAKAVELALLRFLAKENIPHRVDEGVLPPDLGTKILIAGRSSRVVADLISQKRLIQRLEKNPAGWLERELVPPLGSLRRDIHILAGFSALVSKGRVEIGKAIAANQPIHLLNPLPEAWARPTGWRSLGGLSLKLESGNPLRIELGGLDEKRRFQSEELILQPGERLVTEKDFYSLSYLQAEDPPGGRVGLRSPALEKTLLVAPKQWGNLWLYGLQIILLGYLPSQNLKWKRKLLPVRDLRSMSDLFARAHKWAGEHSSI